MQDSSSELVFGEFAECVVRVAVELESLDGMPLRQWLAMAMKDGDVWENERESMAGELDQFMGGVVGQWGEKVISEGAKKCFERKARMTWHALQLEGGKKAKELVKAMKALAMEHYDQNGGIDVSAADAVWKKGHARLGLVACPPPKVFREFLATWKPPQM